MWERGDKAAAIAAALGCKIGAVNVARARFGLKPRRIVSGRPKEPDEPAHKIERVAFTTSRLAEYCSEKELVAQTGHDAQRLAARHHQGAGRQRIDPCEEAGIAPVIKVTITTGKREADAHRGADNGPGIPSATVAGIIDYNVRVSSREAYVSPTRGRQGNALKTDPADEFPVGGKVKGETWIEARGRKHRLSIQHQRHQTRADRAEYHKPFARHTGTRVTMFWPDVYEAPIDAAEIGEQLTEFVWVNPHLTFRFAWTARP